MNPLQLALAYLRSRPVATLLLVALLALGSGTIGFVALTDERLARALTRDAEGIDLVVGAKGSALQLILAGIFHVDAPTGNIPVAAIAQVAALPMVKRVVPLSLGDSVRGFRIVGTTPAFLDLYGARLRTGTPWKSTMEAVIGADVARATGLGIGDRFVGSHGLEAGGSPHDDAVYTVTGILEPRGNVVDRLVLVSTESVWFVHEGTPADAEERTVLERERQVTTLLVQYASPLAAVSLPRRINSETNLQAASPAYEAARLFRLIGVGTDVIRAFGVVVILTAGLSLFIALHNALAERAYDIAVLRTLGMPSRSIVAMLVLEALAIGVAGAVAGLGLAYLLVAALSLWLQGQNTLQVPAWQMSWHDLRWTLPVIAAAIAAALVPAWRASRTDVSATLARRD